MTSVIVVPPQGARGIDRNLRIWAQQYRSADTRHRDVVELASDSAEAVVAATQIATVMAGRDGETHEEWCAEFAIATHYSLTTKI